MLNPTILPDEAGILYRSASKNVLWAFHDVSPPIASVESMHDVLSGEVVINGPFVAKTHRVYAFTLRMDEPINSEQS
jgi:hypothetical protein